MQRILPSTAPYLLLLALFMAFCQPSYAGKNPLEFSLPSSTFDKLDPFEAHRLTEADKLFASKQYPAARAAYDGFILEFPQSAAIPYAILQKARSLDLEEKRYEAIKVYQELIDYFPNEPAYAAPALYFIGMGHWNNGNPEQAEKTWSKLADDPEYRKQPLAADAFNRLAQAAQKNNKPDDAAKYFRLVATGFRNSNEEAAFEAIRQLLTHYTRTKPDLQALQTLYTDTLGWEKRPIKLEADILKNQNFWAKLIEAIESNGSFAETETAPRTSYYQYWSSALQSQPILDDSFQLAVLRFTHRANQDTTNWLQAIDNLHKTPSQTPQNDRYLLFLSELRASPHKQQEYTQKLDWPTLSHHQARSLMRILFDKLANPTLAQAAFAKLPLSQYSDKEKLEIADELRRYDGKLLRELLMTTKDKDLGLYHILRYYTDRRDHQNGLPIAQSIEGNPQYANDVLWMKGELLYHSKQYEQAIAAYKQVEKPPDQFWRIAECYVRLGKPDQAIAQLREVENFLKDQSSEAALRIAFVYRDSGNKDQFIASLRAVLKKYPKSKQSSSAHQELEKLGVRIGGGLDADG